MKVLMPSTAALLCFALISCKTMSQKGHAEMKDKGATSKATDFYQKGCQKGEAESCLALSFLACDGSESKADACIKFSESTSTDDMKLKLREVVQSGCSANANPKLKKPSSKCDQRLGLLDCFSGKLDVCDAVAKGVNRPNFIHEFACREGRVENCKALYLSLTSSGQVPETAKLSAVYDGCKAGHQPVCAYQSEMEADLRTKSLKLVEKKKAAAQEQTEQEIARGKLLEQEAKSGKCHPSNYQAFSTIVSRFNDFLPNMTDRKWRLLKHSIFSAGNKPEAFELQVGASRQVIVAMVTDEYPYQVNGLRHTGRDATVKLTDASGNEAGDVKPEQESVILAIRTTDPSVIIPSAKFLITNPYQTARLSVTGFGCTLMLVASKY